MDAIAAYSVKGGVGKTATAVNLAALAALHGRRTLLWDLDPQGATSWYLETRAEPAAPLDRLLRGKGLKRAVQATRHRNLSLLPAGPAYRDLDLHLNDMKRSRKRIAEVLERLRERFDTVIIDCPPGLSLVADNVFRAADMVLVPLVPSWLSARAYEQMRAHLRDSGIHPGAVYAFLNMVDRRRRVHRDFRQRLGRELPDLTDIEVPYSSLVERMGEDRRPLVYSHPRSEPAQAFAELWRRIDGRMLP